jgi:hypothetical protein
MAAQMSDKLGFKQVAFIRSAFLSLKDLESCVEESGKDFPQLDLGITE